MSIERLALYVNETLAIIYGAWFRQLRKDHQDKDKLEKLADVSFGAFSLEKGADHGGVEVHYSFSSNIGICHSLVEFVTSGKDDAIVRRNTYVVPFYLYSTCLSFLFRSRDSTP